MTVPSDVSIPSCRLDSEFTSMVSRGKLTHPSELLFDLSLYFYAFFKLREDKSCNVVFLQAFEQIHGLSEFHIDGNLKSICRIRKDTPNGHSKNGHSKQTCIRSPLMRELTSTSAVATLLMYLQGLYIPKPYVFAALLTMTEDLN